tara:strand:- start:161 stop:928 length:768 start_codon:yes stop_codon:yes gene_type:complete
MSVFGYDEIGSNMTSKLFNSDMQKSIPIANLVSRPIMNESPYHGYTDIEEESEENTETHSLVTPNSWFGGNTRIAERPEGATAVGTVTAIQNRGLFRDYDYDPETDTETESTTHWWDDDAGESITNEEATTRISALSSRSGVGSLIEYDDDDDGEVDGYSWTQNVERTFWNFFGNSQDQTRTNTGGNRGANQDTSSEIVIHTNPQKNLGPGGTQQQTKTNQTTISNSKKIATGFATIVGVGFIGKVVYDKVSKKF